MKQKASPGQIYEQIVELTDLNETHRQELKTKRGFNDALITTLKFRSCGPDMAAVVLALREKIELQSLMSAGVVSSSAPVTAHLADPDKILIPYLDKYGKPYYLKCHKKGNLPGQGVMPYSQMTYAQHFQHAQEKMMGAIVLCESEFKAAAMWQLGFRAVGLNGIQTFSGKNLPMLEEIIAASRDLFILFDNEIQDDPSIPETFKDNPASRHAHHIWAYEMAIRLDRHFIHQFPDLNVRIARLPKSWIPKGEGKIDCDYALALGANADKLTMVLADSLEPEEFRRSLKNDISMQDILAVDRRLQQAHHQSSLFEINNQYMKRIPKKDGFEDVILSNFTMKMMNIIANNGEMFREVRIHSAYANSDTLIVFDAESYGKLDKFKTKLLKSGDYVFKGKQNDLDALCEQLSLEHPGTMTKAITQVGRIEEDSIWAFKNFFVTDNGVHLEFDKKNNSYYDATTRTHWRVMAGSETMDYLPEVCKESDITIKEIFNRMSEAWGEAVAIQAIAYALSCIFSNVFFDMTKAFPIAFLFGERNAGKTCLSDIMSALAGVPPVIAPMNLSVSTDNGIMYRLGRYQSLPVRLDEYREEEAQIKKKQNMLRSLYNRQSGVKGTRTAFKTLDYKLSGCVIMMGEQFPGDPALYSRCIPIHLKNKKTVQSSIAVNWLYDHINELSHMTYKLICEYASLREKIKKKFMENKKDFSDIIKEDYNPRALNHVGMMATMMEILFEGDEDLLKRSAQVLSSIYQENLGTQNESSVLYKFFEDIAMLTVLEPSVRTCGVIYTDYGKKRYAFVDLQLLHKRWQDRMGKDNPGLCTLSTLNNYLKSQSYLVAMKVEANINNSDSSQGRPCVVFNLNDPSIPEGLMRYATTLSEKAYGLVMDEAKWEKILQKS